MIHRRMTYHVVRFTQRARLDFAVDRLVEKSCERYRKHVELHALSYRPGCFELIVTASRRAQLDGFLMHLFRALSRACGGSLLLGRAVRVRITTPEDARCRLDEMTPNLAFLRPLPAKLGGQLDLAGV